mmetsp:Transcript_22457/g.52973  ORF Transcript_22457/g.52973 Transcript_22457/m.52973 type:complete len:97 (-) Transcript_22457:1763-2053(-)
MSIHVRCHVHHAQGHQLSDLILELNSLTLSSTMIFYYHFLAHAVCGNTFMFPEESYIALKKAFFPSNALSFFTLSNNSLCPGVPGIMKNATERVLS